MFDIPERRVKSIVSPWGTVSVCEQVLAVPKEYAGQEVYVTISARIELAEQVDAFRALVSEYFRSGGTLKDLAETTNQPKSISELTKE